MNRNASLWYKTITCPIIQIKTDDWINVLGYEYDEHIIYFQLHFFNKCIIFLMCQVVLHKFTPGHCSSHSGRFARLSTSICNMFNCKRSHWLSPQTCLHVQLPCSVISLNDWTAEMDAMEVSDFKRFVSQANFPWICYTAISPFYTTVS